MLYSINSPYYRQFLSSAVNKYISSHQGNIRRTSRSKAPHPQLNKEEMLILEASEYESMIQYLIVKILFMDQNNSAIVHLALPPP